MVVERIERGLGTWQPRIETTVIATLLASIFSLPLGLSNAHADAGRLTIVEDNDGLLPDGWDRHYTQGAMLSYLSPTLSTEDFASTLADALAAHLPIMQTGQSILRKYSVDAGQSFFTPVRYHAVVPDPDDRPFAGWLHGGGSLLQETDGHMLESFAMEIGVVGPAALARQTQEAFHALAGFNTSNLDAAWSHQLQNEPGVMASYERYVKLWHATALGIESEVIPNAGVTVGNVLTDAEAGGQFRIGRNLGADFGVSRIRPALSGSNWFDVSRMTGSFGWSLFAGVQGRAVAHNIFLDGNSFTDSPSVKKRVLVGDFSTGASLFWSDWTKIDFTFTERTKEFTTQKQMDHFGSVNLSFLF